MNTNQTVLIVIVQNDKTLLEQRALDSGLAGHFIFPGGRVEEEEDLEAAMLRESLEELGIIPTKYFDLTFKKNFLGETGRTLHPFLVIEWDGELSNTVLDKGNPLFWESIEIVKKSPLPSVAEIMAEVEKYLPKQT